MRILPLACRRRVAPLMVQIPPFGGGEVTVRGGKAPKSQTTSVKNTENRVLRLRWSAFWAPHASHALHAVDRGNCAIQGSDTPAKRLQRASHGAKPPPPSALRAREDQIWTYADRLS